MNSFIFLCMINQSIFLIFFEKKDSHFEGRSGLVVWARFGRFRRLRWRENISRLRCWTGICFWSTTRGACSARARRRCRPNRRGSSLGWARAGKSGRPGWRSSAVAACWADSWRAVASTYFRGAKGDDEVAGRLGVLHLANLAGCPARQPRRSDADSRPRPSSRHCAAAVDRRPSWLAGDRPSDPTQRPLHDRPCPGQTVLTVSVTPRFAPARRALLPYSSFQVRASSAVRGLLF